MNDTVIVVTGAAPLARRAISALPPHGIVIAADGGLDHALAAGLHPAGLVGDLDSVTPQGLAWAEEHATIERHAADKDRTDTELALAMAVALNPARLVLVSGGGDRLDHTWAAIGALGHRSLTSIPVIDAWWGEQRFRVLHGPGRTVLDVEVGTPISILATHGPCTGVTLEGTRWTLEHADLAPLVGRGISNLAVEDTVEISVSTGVLTVVVGQPEPAAEHPADDPTETPP